jgi:hypothetical protein
MKRTRFVSADWAFVSVKEVFEVNREVTGALNQ